MSKESKEVKKQEVKEEVAISKKLKEIPPTNELVFRKGDELVIKDLPFVIKEVKGAELTILRTDIK